MKRKHRFIDLFDEEEREDEEVVDQDIEFTLEKEGAVRRIHRIDRI